MKGEARLIRVFPRRTSFTPRDEFAFVGDPPLIRPEADEVHVSVTFFWDKAEGERLARAWGQYYPVSLGGPAYGSPVSDFVPGRYIKPGVTFTSRGCNHRCPWCVVPEREGGLTLIKDFAPGHIIQDNNLLQTSRSHQEHVYAMLKGQRQRAEFSGGLEAALVDDWVAEQLKGLRISQLFLACDNDMGLKPLARALSRLGFLRRNQLRCYVLLGFRGESLGQGLARLEQVWELGARPFAQLYQPPEGRIHYAREWRQAARVWSRPAAMKAIHG